MNELTDVKNDDVELAETIAEISEIPPCDDRYPGSFFTIPAPIVLGRTAWSLT
jgi:hypothetical protein